MTCTDHRLPALHRGGDCSRRPSPGQAIPVPARPRRARRARAWAVLACIVALLAAPLAQAQIFTEQCNLGRSWPTEYETAVENLFAGDKTVAWHVTLLPASGKERGLYLFSAPDGADWTLRYAEADQRVHYWGASRLELRTNQVPDTREVPMPAALARRMMESWRRVVGTLAPAGSKPAFNDTDTWLFVIAESAPGAGDALRASGAKPECKLGHHLLDHVDVLLDATKDGDRKRERRWETLTEQLDRLDADLSATASVE